jgi:hypothetical protein
VDISHFLTCISGYPQGSDFAVAPRRPPFLLPFFGEAKKGSSSRATPDLQSQYNVTGNFLLIPEASSDFLHFRFQIKSATVKKFESDCFKNL